MIWKVFLIVCMLVGAGCSVASYIIADDACKKSNIHCGSSNEESRDIVVAAAEKGFKVDKKIYQEIESKINSKVKSDKNKETSIFCEGEKKKVCTSSRGCECS